MLETSKIPLRKLDRSRAHDFAYKPNAQTQKALATDNDWRKLEALSLSGRLAPFDEGWLLDANLKGGLTQNCVISGEPVKFPLDIKVARKYMSHMPDLPKDFTIEDDFDIDMEPMPQMLDLDALIVEEILLNAPEYPRAQGYQDDAPWQLDATEDQDQSSEGKTSPFANLDKRLLQKE